VDSVFLTIIPASQISVNGQPEVRIATSAAAKVVLNAHQGDVLVHQSEYELERSMAPNKLYPHLQGVTGPLELEFRFYGADGTLLDVKRRNYRIIESPCHSTRLIDGCWISIYHWSEEEGRWFNNALKELTEADWKDQIYAMHRVGINGIVITHSFINNEYAGKHSMTADTYKGKALYPSALYPDRMPIAAADPLEAILTAADDCGMAVFLGVGTFAWFDFSPESLKWHMAVTEELYGMYGRHPSLYGWYVCEEIFGALYYDWPYVEDEKYKDIVHFFQSYKQFIHRLTPTKPVALAPNNIRFHEFAEQWKEILAHVDILLPFAFARDPDNLNIAEIQEICKPSGTHFWVDMEMFDWPLDNGLVPKSMDDMIKEIRTYDALEQLYGFQFTGLMNDPDSPHDLGGEAAKRLYRDYGAYYRKIIGEQAQTEG